MGGGRSVGPMSTDTIHSYDKHGNHRLAATRAAPPRVRERDRLPSGPCLREEAAQGLRYQERPIAVLLGGNWDPVRPGDERFINLPNVIPLQNG